MSPWQWIIVACGGIATLGTAIATVKRWVAPLLSLSKRVEAVERHDKNDMAKLTALEKENQTILNALYALLGHELDGNGTDALKAARKRLWEHIIEK